MPKLRHGDSDAEKFTQWLARKCRNHNPLAELKMDTRSRESKPSAYSIHQKGEPAILEDTPTIILYGEGDRLFEITVEEISMTKHKGRKLQAVGY